MRMARGCARRIGADPEEAEADVLAAYVASESRRSDMETGGSHAWLAVKAEVMRGHSRRQPAGLRPGGRWTSTDHILSLDQTQEFGDWWQVALVGSDPTGDAATSNADLHRALANMDRTRHDVLLAEAQGYTQHEIAERLGVNQAMVSKIARGKVAAPGARRQVDATVRTRVALAQEAIAAGTAVHEACKAHGLSTATLWRHRNRPTTTGA